MGAPRESPAASMHALRPDGVATMVVVTLTGRLDRDGASRIGDQAGEILRASGARRLVCDVSGVTQADAAVVDAVCRIRLASKRLGAALRLSGVSPDLLRLLDLTGLCEAVVGRSEIWFERQPEEREHPGGVEEERDAADPIA